MCSVQSNGRKANSIGHTLRRNWRLKHIIEGNIEIRGRRGRRRKQFLDDLKEKKGYWKMEEEALAELCREPALEEAMDLS